MIDKSGKLEKLYNIRTQVFEKVITSAANAGNVLVGTITTQPIIIVAIILHANSASQTDLTSAAIYGGAAIATHTITFLDAAQAAKANIDAADEQVAWTGTVRLAAGKVIAIELLGTGVTVVDLTVSIEYVPAIAGGYII